MLDYVVLVSDDSRGLTTTVIRDQKRARSAQNFGEFCGILCIFSMYFQELSGTLYELTRIESEFCENFGEFSRNFAEFPTNLTEVVKTISHPLPAPAPSTALPHVSPSMPRQHLPARSGVHVKGC